MDRDTYSTLVYYYVQVKFSVFKREQIYVRTSVLYTDIRNSLLYTDICNSVLYTDIRTSVLYTDIHVRTSVLYTDIRTY